MISQSRVLYHVYGPTVSNTAPRGRFHEALVLKLDFLTNAMHLLYALVRKSSFSKAQGFVKPAPGRDLFHLAVV